MKELGRPLPHIGSQMLCYYVQGSFQIWKSLVGYYLVVIFSLNMKIIVLKWPGGGCALVGGRHAEHHLIAARLQLQLLQLSHEASLVC